MKKIKITLEMGGEASTLSLNTNKSLIEVIEHIGKIREEETLESFIESQISNEGGYIYESPDNGATIYRRKLGEKVKQIMTKEDRKKIFHDMGGSYEVRVKEPKQDIPMSEWICSYCGDHTYHIDYDYLIGVDHLSCALANEREKKEKG